MRACARCGGELPAQIGRGRPRKYCTGCTTVERVGMTTRRIIHRAAEPRLCSGCSTPLPRAGRPSAWCRECNPRRPKGVKGRRVSKLCGWCSKSMVLKPSVTKVQSYCSITCSMKARRHREGAHQRVKLIACVACGKSRAVRRSIRIGKESGKYCSRECAFHSRALVCKEAAALRRIALNWAPKPNLLVQAEIAALRRIARFVGRRIKTLRPCTACGTRTIGYGERKRICASCKQEKIRQYRKTAPSRKAHKRIYKARRRAIERGLHADQIDPIKVFERDGWRCHLCGCKTPRHLRGTCEPNAPEMDHVIPLAAGGTHTWGNVKCSCRRCNGSKAAKPFGQLGLEIAA